MAERSVTDWCAVEAEFAEGKRSIRQIAKRHGVSDTAIHKRAKAGEWVRSGASGATSARPAPQQAVQVIIPARKILGEHEGGAIGLAGDLAHRLLGELDVATLCQDEIEAAVDADTRDDENGARRAMMLKAVSLPARALTLKTIAQALAVLKDVEQGAEKGKKQLRQESAQKSASGRFAPPAPPKLVVDNAG